MACCHDHPRCRRYLPARKLVYHQDGDGMWVIHAMLPPEAGALVVKAIGAITAPLQAQKQEELQQGVSAETFLGVINRLLISLKGVFFRGRLVVVSLELVKAAGLEQRFGSAYQRMPIRKLPLHRVLPPGFVVGRLR